MIDPPRCRILVVEDEAVIAMEDMLLDFGSEVVGPAAKMDEARFASRPMPL